MYVCVYVCEKERERDRGGVGGRLAARLLYASYSFVHDSMRKKKVLCTREENMERRRVSE
jgi:hypothetical protein